MSSNNINDNLGEVEIPYRGAYFRCEKFLQMVSNKQLLEPTNWLVEGFG